MALSKAEISAKFASGEWKVCNSTLNGDVIPISEMDRETLISSMEKGLNIRHNDFPRLISLLLRPEIKYETGMLMNGLGVFIRNKCLQLAPLRGSCFIMVNLDDRDNSDLNYYWGLTEMGLIKQPLIGWLKYCACMLENSLVRNYKPELRGYNPYVWEILDWGQSGYQPRPGQAPETGHGRSIEDYYKNIEKQVQAYLNPVSHDLGVVIPREPSPSELDKLREQYENKKAYNRDYYKHKTKPTKEQEKGELALLKLAFHQERGEVPPIPEEPTGPRGHKRPMNHPDREAPAKRTRRAKH